MTTDQNPYVGSVGQNLADFPVLLKSIEPRSDAKFGDSFLLTLEDPDGRMLSWFRKRPSQFEEGDYILLKEAYIKSHIKTAVGERTLLTHVTATHDD